MSRQEEVRRLRRSAPRSSFLRWSGIALMGLVVAAWSNPARWPFELMRGPKAGNFMRFLREEIVPFPLRDGAWTFSDLASWASDLFVTRGARATAATLAISGLAILISATFAWLSAPLAARNIATKRPGEPRGTEPDALVWRLTRALTIGVFIALRALPEYVLAFLAIALLGPNSAWPAVVALAIHNAGILGRLSAETIENLEPAPLQALRYSGARRSDLIIGAVGPLSLGRCLTYFFYRFETCVRESTALGMLGIASLGYWISDAQANHYYDEVFFFVALSALIVIGADWLSAVARRSLRSGS